MKIMLERKMKSKLIVIILSIFTFGCDSNESLLVNIKDDENKNVSNYEENLKESFSRFVINIPDVKVDSLKIKYFDENKLFIVDEFILFEKVSNNLSSVIFEFPYVGDGNYEVKLYCDNFCFSTILEDLSVDVFYTRTNDGNDLEIPELRFVQNNFERGPSFYCYMGFEDLERAYSSPENFDSLSYSSNCSD